MTARGSRSAKRVEPMPHLSHSLITSLSTAGFSSICPLFIVSCTLGLVAAATAANSSSPIRLSARRGNNKIYYCNTRSCCKRRTLHQVYVQLPVRRAHIYSGFDLMQPPFLRAHRAGKPAAANLISHSAAS